MAFINIQEAGFSLEFLKSKNRKEEKSKKN
jgi:hypothetical protein